MRRIPIIPEFSGLDTDRAALTASAAAAVSCENVLTDDRLIRTRKGRSLRLAGEALQYPRGGHPFAHERFAYLVLITSNGARTEIKYKLVDPAWAVIKTETLNFAAGSVPFWIPTAAQAPGVVYLLSEGAGQNRKLFYSTTAADWRFRPLGMIAPAAGPTVTTLVSGALSAQTVYISTTWYEQDTDSESPGSPETTHVVNLNSGLRVIRTAHNLPFEPTHWRIYIRRDGLDSIGYRLATVAYATSTYDLTSQTVLDNLSRTFDDQRPSSGLGSPPIAHAGAWHDARFWYADALHPGRVQCSEIAKADLCDPVNTFDCGERDGDFIAGMFTRDRMLHVLKQRSVWTIAGNALSSYTTGQRESGPGCNAPHTIKHFGRTTFFRGPNAVYRWSDRGVEQISPPIRSLLPSTQPQACSAAIDEYRGLYVLVESDWARSISRQFVFDMRRETWTQWDQPLSGAVSRMVDPGSTLQVLAGGNASPGDLFALAGSLDNDTSPFAWNWQSHPLLIGTPLAKRIGNLQVGFDGRGSASPGSLRAEVSIDGGAWTDLGSQALSATACGVKVYPVGVNGSTIGVRLSGTSGADLHIGPVFVEVEEIGQR